MLRNSIVLFSVLVLTIGIWIGPKSSLLLLIDFGLAILNRLDGVEKFNTKQSNYVDGNWAPTHQELDQIKMTGNGFITESLIGKEVYIMPRGVSKKRPSRLTKSKFVSGSTDL